MGEFVAYDLNTIFNNRNGNPAAATLSNQALNIAKDPFLETEAYTNNEAYRILELKVSNLIKENEVIDEKKLEKLIQLNQNYWKAYYLAGLYFYKHKQYAQALINFKLTAKKEFTTLPC